jgi:iron complex outermembrane receptor protein
MKTVIRCFAVCWFALVLLTVSGRGAESPSGPQAPATSGETVVLSAFEVKGTAGFGYRTSNSVTGTKSLKPLIDIPASVSIVTRDFIDDMVSRQTIGDIFKYAVAGSPPSTNRNNFVQVRGQRFEAPWQDGVRVSNSPNELSVIDSIEILKGVNSVLYGTRVPAGGLVNRITKRPQVVPATSLKLQYGSYDFRRAEFDTTGAVPGTDKKFAYRLVAAWQDDPGYRGRSDQDAYAPMFQYSSGGTTVRHQFIWSETTTAGEFPGGIANPDGTPYLRAGRRTDYKADWSFTRKETGLHATTWVQKIGEWESRVVYMAERTERDDEDHRRQGAANFTTNLSPHRYFGQAELRSFDSLQQDLVGHYDLGGVRVNTNLGWSQNREILNQDRQEIDLATGRAIGVYSRATVATPAQGLMNIFNPSLAAIRRPGDADRIIPGRYADTRTVVTGTTFFGAQSFDVVPKRLSLTLGGSYAKEKSSVHDLPDATQREAQRRDESNDWLYSVGAVYTLTPKVKLFAQTGTTFSPNQANATTPSGLRPPPVVGESYETGLKFNLLDDRIWGSVTVYQLDLKGFATFNSTVNAFVVTDTYNRGAECELWIEPVRGLQFIATAFTAEVEGPGGARVNQSFKEAWSLWAKYSVASGRLKGFQVGAGFFHRGTLFYATGVNSPGYTTLDMTAGYSAARWSVQMSARNLTDEVYNIGSTGANNIDGSVPPSVQATFTYRF